ncbi:hypothetical protein Daesc_005707 [Daldinia eschscholtzii]|uniref:Nephrocystin 3-like N-terminal domain-containing protein n=1 Tax=Daldinia eschscholtzii TaxID=292717 RepID=A0AAX6MLS7_9PEZI
MNRQENIISDERCETQRESTTQFNTSVEQSTPTTNATSAQAIQPSPTSSQPNQVDAIINWPEPFWAEAVRELQREKPNVYHDLDAILRENLEGDRDGPPDLERLASDVLDVARSEKEKTKKSLSSDRRRIFHDVIGHAKTILDRAKPLLDLDPTGYAKLVCVPLTLALGPSEVLASIVRQLSRSGENEKASQLIMNHWKRFLDQNGLNEKPPKLALQECEDLLEKIFGITDQITIIIDALDECADPRELLEVFQNFEEKLKNRTSPAIKVFLSSRDEVKVLDQLRPDLCEELVLRPEDTAEDLQVFIDTSIGDAIKKSRSHPLRIDGNLKRDIISALVDHGKGAFKWTQLHLALISDFCNEDDIRKSLYEIRAESSSTYLNEAVNTLDSKQLLRLYDTYDLLYKQNVRGRRNGEIHFRRVMRLVLVHITSKTTLRRSVNSTLTVELLMGMAATDPKEVKDPEGGITKEYIQRITSNFLVINKDSTVGFSHVSVKEYLQHARSGFFSDSISNAYVAASCLSSVRYFYRDITAETLYMTKKLSPAEYFLCYSILYWKVHYGATDSKGQQEDPLRDQFSKFMVTKDVGDAYKAGQEEIVEQLLTDEVKNIDINSRDRRGRTPLSLAGGKENISTLLLNRGADPQITDFLGRTYLWFATLRLSSYPEEIHPTSFSFLNKIGLATKLAISLASCDFLSSGHCTSWRPVVLALLLMLSEIGGVSFKTSCEHRYFAFVGNPYPKFKFEEFHIGMLFDGLDGLSYEFDSRYEARIQSITTGLKGVEREGYSAQHLIQQRIVKPLEDLLEDIWLKGYEELDSQLFPAASDLVDWKIVWRRYEEPAKENGLDDSPFREALIAFSDYVK